MSHINKNSGEEDEVKESKKLEKNIRLQKLTDLRHLFSIPQFQRDRWDLIAKCGVFTLSFNHSGSVTSFNEGTKSIGLDLLNEWFEASPDTFIKMMKENKERKEKANV